MPAKTAGIAKLLIAGGPVRDPVTGASVSNAGMGIVVDWRHVLTCAHVVNTALQERPDAVERPVEERRVPVVFPHAAGGRCSEGKVVVWHPMGDTPVGDVAVLELVDEDVPREVGFARFVRVSQSLDDDALQVFGYRAGGEQGSFVDAKFMGQVGPGRVQIVGTTVIGVFIEGGYSGAAVWDTEHRAVVGMVSARNVDRADRVAYMIPVSDLKKAWPALRINVRPWWPTVLWALGGAAAVLIAGTIVWLHPLTFKGTSPAAKGEGPAANSAPADSTRVADRADYLAGTVREEGTDKRVSGATVTIDLDDRDGKTPTAQTDEAGRYRFRDLPPGPVKLVGVHVRKAGYRPSYTKQALGTESHMIELQPEP
jgi:hypothetical protein